MGLLIWLSADGMVQGLRPTDIDGLADPFVRFATPTSSKQIGQKRTRTVHKTLNPEFNEALSFWNLRLRYSKTHAQPASVCVFRMTVMDEDTHCNEPMGEIRVALKRLKPQQPSYANFPTTGRREQPGADPPGPPVLGGAQRLVVNIVRCVRLPSRDNGDSLTLMLKCKLNPMPQDEDSKLH
ncbi:double C2-like domain-containing protein beta [Caerostris extrusa]|uniref:Double C2-like domain-containing protein beta n=1 Tax=Caerostris extrusa TaxID=172846 RepID=A0AAV4UWB8_CAEEX|nr:double C2-like domain-containing protein beta [Caerostris extrusa]